MKFGLTDTELESIVNAFRQFKEIEEVLLFGSRAMNTFKPTSDIDLAIKGAKLTLNTITSLNAQLEELSVVYMFDVVNYNKVDNPKFIKHIDRYGIRIYAQTKGQANYFLKNVTSKIGSGATPRGGQEAYHDEGISLIRSQNVLDFDFSYRGLAFIDDDQAYKLKNVIVEENDILLNITGDSVARVCKVPTEVLPARVNQHVAIIRPNPKKLDYDYLLYYLLNPPFKKYMLKIASDGATRNAITKVDIEDFEIVAPKNVGDQKEIVTILSTLDQKIALLKKQNQTLEELAQTLFKRWFVDFEFPNLSTSSGKASKPYKSSGGKMIASELGEIPDGWSVENLSSMANYLNGFACQKHPVENNKEKLPVLKIKELGNGISENSDWVTSKIDGKYIIQNGDTIFSWSGTLMIKIWDGEECALNQYLFKVTSSKYPDWFIYQWTNLHLDKFIAIAKSKATTMGHIKRTHLDEATCSIPTSEVLEQFHSSFSEMLKAFKNNTKEIQTLTQLRDTLLPKLMSGSLEIKKELL